MSVMPEFRGLVVAAVIGPDHSPLFPSVFYGAWLDGSGDVIAMTGTTVSHASFEVFEHQVVNTVTIDVGVCPASTPARFGLMDTAAGDNLILWAPVVFEDSEGSPVTPDMDDPLSFAPWALVFEYTEA